MREALTQFITEVKTKQRKSQMAEKARELLSDYRTDEELTPFTDIDSEDFLLCKTFHIIDGAPQF